MDRKMKAAVLSGYGSPEVIHCKEVEIPKPKTREVLVKIHASSATRADSMMRTGKPFIGRLILGLRKPKHTIPGTGFAGEIVEIGPDVTSFNLGDQVFGETTTNFSTNAEYAVVPEKGVILHKPENLSYESASTFCDGNLTSINFLKNVGLLKPGQKILINGASGSLGTSAVQLAKYMGAEVTAVCSYRNVGMVKSLGADHVIDYTKEDFTKGKIQYDLIYDTIGKSSFDKTKSILTKNGAYISPVLKFPLLVKMLLTTIFGKKKARFEATGMKKEEELKELLTELVKIFKEGKLKSVIDRQYPLEKVSQAHAYIDTGRKKGNVVIINASTTEKKEL
ncbi:NAD(P)-dependent alcohol dehydrogenase [Membranihabitans maritimus]|uniref:NAD(P)-dependent alcohol dehydrogenase n=1 Tax=Membranihabitans maritimus TaxID=2904244 RepID=UPI001F263E66|nr:NAD(P)-dependent alcohol dehydrogenase [Membranihabitans maritimus]